MVFKRMMASLGSGGASVDTVLTNPNVYPGGVLEGRVDIKGGDVDQDIDYVQVSLQAKAEIESDDYEYQGYVEFGKQRLTNRFDVDAHQNISFPFQVQIPWETPPNVIGGRPIPGIDIGLKTELEIRGARDSSDKDAVYIHPLPAQTRILEALERMGWRFKTADLEKGRIRGSQLPVYQEIEFAPPPQHASNINELEVTFLGGPHETRVVFEADMRGGWFSEGRDAVQWFAIPTAGGDVRGIVEQQLHALGQRRGWF